MVNDNDLEEIYKLYPKKLGKSPGMKKARRVIKTVFDVDDLRMAVENYKKYLARENTPPQYIMYFSTFMNQWEDWIELDLDEAIPKAIDPTADAKKCLEAVRSIPPGRPEELKEFLGERLFKIACKVNGGIAAIRQMPSNEFTLKNLAGMLKDAESRMGAA
jgi:hypothetical protein